MTWKKACCSCEATRQCANEKNRLEAFSDGVFAVIITVMVLEMEVPRGSELRALQPVLPVFVTHVLSFIYLGIYWNNHHHLHFGSPAASAFLSHSCGLSRIVASSLSRTKKDTQCTKRGSFPPSHVGGHMPPVTAHPSATYPIRSVKPIDLAVSCTIGV
jgi:hypothetical protein